MPNKTRHQTAIPLRSIAAGELGGKRLNKRVHGHLKLVELDIDSTLPPTNDSDADRVTV